MYLTHSCFLEESVEEDIEDYINSPLATFLKYAFPLIKRIWEKSFCSKCELVRITNFYVIECDHDRTRDTKFNKKTIGGDDTPVYEVRDFHFHSGPGRDPMVRTLLPPYEK